MNKKFSAFHKAENHFFSLVSFKQIDYDNLTAFATGVQAAGLNPAIVKKVDNDFTANLIECQFCYTQEKLPWALVLPEYLANASIESLIKNQSLTLTGKGVAMAASIDTFQWPSVDSPLLIKEMYEDLATWSIPLIHGFESTPEVTGIYTERHQSAFKKTKKLYHFSGFIDDAVVCSLTLSLCGNDARIDDVATMPQHQKQGHATNLIYAALQKAKQLNVNQCFLEASDSGFNLYKRMGFKALFKNHYYEKL